MENMMKGVCMCVCISLGGGVLDPFRMYEMRQIGAKV